MDEQQKSIDFNDKVALNKMERTWEMRSLRFKVFWNNWALWYVPLGVLYLVLVVGTWCQMGFRKRYLGGHYFYYQITTPTNSCSIIETNVNCTFSSYFNETGCHALLRYSIHGSSEQYESYTYFSHLYNGSILRLPMGEDNITCYYDNRYPKWVDLVSNNGRQMFSSFAFASALFLIIFMINTVDCFLNLPKALVLKSSLSVDNALEMAEEAYEQVVQSAEDTAKDYPLIQFHPSCDANATETRELIKLMQKLNYSDQDLKDLLAHAFPGVFDPKNPKPVFIKPSNETRSYIVEESQMVMELDLNVKSKEELELEFKKTFGFSRFNYAKYKALAH
jgi:hypothetical protein